MNVLIIEDERPSARRLSRMLDKMNVEVLQMLHSVDEAVKWFKNNTHPELIFLDIQLSDGLSFEIFDQVDITSAIIFTTAYDEYALRAFKLNSVDYLLKPIDENELGAAVDKYSHKPKSAQHVQLSYEDVRKLLLKTATEREYKKRFTTRIGQHIKMISVDDVSCFYSHDKGTYAHTTENRDYLLETTLELLEQELEPAKFFRVSRKYYVNINAIKDIVAYTNSRLQIKLNAAFNDHEIIVSRERVRDFKRWLG